MRSRRSLFAFAIVLLTGCQVAYSQSNMGEARVFEHTDGTTMPYRFLPPPNTQADGDGYPLIVFLHGAGERGSDNSIQMRVHISGLRDATQTDEYASFLIAPQLPSGNTRWNPNETYDLTMEIINQVANENPVDMSRIYVTGLSLGGNGSFNYISAFPDFFAAAVPMSGWGTPATADTIAEVPVWTFHGDADGTINVSGSRDMYYALDANGGDPLHTDIQRGGHVIWSPIYSDWESDRQGLYPWLFSNSVPAQQVRQLINADSSWRFLDDGTDPGKSWQDISFDDSTWHEGAGQLGYGENDQTTLVNCGSSAPTCREDNFATTYFRRAFEVDDLSEIVSLTAELVRDDSAAVYLNGTEIFRDSTLPLDADFETYAGNSENSHIGLVIDPTHLVTGTNVIGVEVHQRSATNSDLSFDLRLSARIVPEPTSTLSFVVCACLALAWQTRAKRRSCQDR